MATAETVELSPPHAPREESIKSFKELEHELKAQLVHFRHYHDKHEKEYFQAAASLSDHELANFSLENLEEVRVGESSYGYHLFGRLRIPALPADGPSYVFFRAFDTGKESEAKFHSFHTEQAEDKVNGGFKFRAIFTKDDPLEWFNE
ncbi:hypothetical protein SLS53_005537 [Cytospora paraplurivora]|uniref:Uncharacterized protein n=1 Tax=Cytospora paraplurivora TaxID=2898453 RepID=A0AAN9U5B2_9PEZI